MAKITESIILVAAIALGALWLATPSAQADEPKTLTKSVRDEFACPGMQAEWLDDKTVQCQKEAP